MAFIDRMIGTEEKILCRTNPHWIYILQGTLLLIFFLICGHVADHEVKNYIREQLYLQKESQLLYYIYNARAGIYWSCMIIGLGVFFIHLIFYRSTHIAITSDRLIYKTGMFFVDVSERSLEEIKGETVHNGFFGKFLDYGFVELDCRFVKNLSLPAVSRPYSFLHDLHRLIKKNTAPPIGHSIGS